MTPWIFVSLGAIAIAGVGMTVVARKTARLGPSTHDHNVRVMSGRQSVLFGLLLVLATVLTIAFTDMSLWFLPIVIFLTVWMPQVARKAATSRHAIIVSAMFTVAMVASVVVRVFIMDY